MDTQILGYVVKFAMPTCSFLFVASGNPYLSSAKYVLYSGRYLPNGMPNQVGLPIHCVKQLVLDHGLDKIITGTKNLH